MSYFRRTNKRRRTTGNVPYPKRQIQKVSEIVEQTITNAQQDQELLSSSIDGVTLVRMVGNLGILPATNAQTFTMVIHRLPANATIGGVNNGVGNTVYDNTEQVLWAQSIAIPATGDVTNIPVDIRAMRKLRAGDKIYFSSLGQVANSGVVRGQLMMFGKMP